MHPLAIILQQELVAAWGILEGNAVDGPGAKHSHSSCCLRPSHHVTSRHVTAQHSTAQHSTAQHSTAQRSAAQRNHHHHHTIKAVTHATLYTAHSNTKCRQAVQLRTSRSCLAVMLLQQQGGGGRGGGGGKQVPGP